LGSTSRKRAASRGAEQACRLDVLRVPDREDEAANNAGVGGPCDHDDGKRGVPEPAPEHCSDDHREDDRWEREDEVDQSHRNAVDDPAEVAGKTSYEPTDDRGERDEQQRDRDRHACAVDHAAEDVPPELVGSEEVCAARSFRSRECLCKRIVRRDQRREDRHDQPGDCDHGADDGQRLPPRRARRADGAPATARAKGQRAHLTRILGSITPYKTSTMKFTVM
jgi:hypothetical protein